LSFLPQLGQKAASADAAFPHLGHFFVDAEAAGSMTIATPQLGQNLEVDGTPFRHFWPPGGAQRASQYVSSKRGRGRAR